MNHLGVVSRGGGWLVSRLLRVDSGSLVGHIGNIAVISVGGVGHVLDSAIGKSHGVRSGHVAGTIGLLLALEVGLGVVIGHGVGEGVGGDLIGVLLGFVSGSGLVGNRSGGICWGSMVGGSNNWSSMVGGSVVSDRVNSVVSDRVNSVVSDRVNSVMSDGVDSVVDSVVKSVVDSMVGNWGNSVVRDDGGLAYWDDPVGSNGGLDLRQTLGVVGLGHGGVGGSESLGLTESSDLTVSGGD